MTFYLTLQLIIIAGVIIAGLYQWYQVIKCLFSENTGD